MKHRWLPTKRVEQVNMARVWTEIGTARGASLGIPDKDITELGGLTTQAETCLDHVLSGERSPISIAECNRVFSTLIAKMQYIKERFFLSPPLVDEDYSALLLRMPNRNYSPIAQPDAVPSITVSFPAPGQVVLNHRGPLNGKASNDPRADEKVCIGFGFIGEGSAGSFIKMTEVPTSGSELPNRITSKRKNLQIDFDLCRGMMLYLSACYMNAKDEPGPWGPVSAVTVP
ncbi:MAG: hypothetical protein LBB43_05455 [Spirochaetaceae bacterium]|jgi:hypothetical protein|nr:hypothetical protein [Spirochaetaceae bacterium]